MTNHTSRPASLVLVGFQDQDNLGLRYLMSSVQKTGFGTQIVMFGQPGSGKIVLLDQSGTIKTGPFLVPGP